MSIRTIFYGTSSFAVPILEALAKDERFDLVGVVTQPDRPVGRHAELQPSPVKLTAQTLSIPVYQFEKVKSDEAFAELQKLSADVAVVASFGQIIPQRVIDLTPHGMINVHGSILPKYRGASPVAGAIRAGERETGITIMKMDALMDHGPILSIATEPIRSDDTTETLLDRLAMLGAKTLPDVLVGYIEGTIKPQEQDHSQATSVKLLKREDGLIEWKTTAEEIERLVRAYDPWPGTYALVDGKRLKILQTSVGKMTDKLSGTRFVEEGEPAVACAEGTSILLKKVQPEGKAAMTGKDFLRGRSDFPLTRGIEGVTNR